jgi:glutamate-1-semialdehyde 2,1-aminomutase
MNIGTDVTGPATREWSGSIELLKRARKSLVGGVSSPFRAKAPVPLYLRDARGSRMWDVDGNEYIDYTLAWGPLILGHRHPAITAAVVEQAEKPHIYGAQHELEFEVAERIQSLVPCAQRVAFTSSGSEAVQIVLRLARAFTGREKIVKFEGHYHGWMDSVLLSYKPSKEQLARARELQAIPGSAGQVGNAAENVLVLPWNDLDSARRLFAGRGREIAAVITEPVLCNSGCLLPEEGYLAELASIAGSSGALLIFDEVITGFRLAPGGAQSHYAVTPDLATLGKAIGAGLPLSAIVGRAEIMDLIADGSVGFGGTFNGNPISLAAALAALDELSRENGEALRRANRTGEAIMEGLRDSARRRGVPLAVTGFGAAFAVHFTSRKELRDYRHTLDDDKHLLRAFLMDSLNEGIAVLPDGRLYVSAVHSDQDIEQTAAAFDRVLARLATV